jgi:hypothetical protein
MFNNKVKAAFEELGCVLEAAYAKRLFQKLYIYLLYNDPAGFSGILEYRMRLAPVEKSREDYLLFRFMLQLMREKHDPALLNMVRADRVAA